MSVAPMPSASTVDAPSDQVSDAELAQQTYTWLDEQFRDRDDKDFDTLEASLRTLVG